ncbi:MAG: sensor histidine kinase [Rhodobacteraceae bacterium]|nr:sensor histidine kinase [Paracoccaceae bacterium]
MDEGRALALGGVLAPEALARFEPVPSGLIDFGFGSGRFWVNVDLENASDISGTWWVTHDIPVAESLHVQIVPEGPGALPRQLLALTDRSPFSERSIANRHLVSEITLGPSEKATLLVDYTSAQAKEMPLFIEAVPRFFSRTQSETVEIVALTALVLGMGVISTIYHYGLAERPGVAYGIYVLSGAGLLVHMEGYAFQYIWPNWPALNQIALPIIGTLFVALGTNFVSRFTQSERFHPRLHKRAVPLIALLTGMAAASPFLVSFDWFKYAVLFSILLGTLTQILLAVAAFSRKQSGSSALLLGFGALASSISFGVLGYLTEGLFEQELAGSAIRFGFLAEAAAFAAAIALRVRATRKQRDASMTAQLQISEDRLKLSEALRRAEEDRQEASNAAGRSRAALATTAHDMRQPLEALQLVLKGGETEPGRLTSSLDYLKDILQRGLEIDASPLGTGDADPPEGHAAERFEVSVVLRNLQGMFAAEAQQRGVDLRVVDSSAVLVADPLAVLRILGNLVSNVLQHGNPSRVLVGCRRSSGGVRFEIYDDGKGVSEAKIATSLRAGEKGEGSDGQGLGLAIVSELAAQAGMDFSLNSRRGQETQARLSIANILSKPLLQGA